VDEGDAATVVFRGGLRRIARPADVGQIHV
jgi:hypothetical protein